jgi:hypothetical protein
MLDSASILRRFDYLKEKVQRHPRIAGVYILEAAAVPTSAESVNDQESFLRAFAAPFGFVGPHVGDAEWRDAEAFREEVRRTLVESLVGGPEIGHSRWDVPPALAEAFAEEFVSLFDDDARFFHSGLGADANMFGPQARPDIDDFIFGGGCLGIDGQIAAIFWMLDID